MTKFLERKFTIPGMAGLLPIANDMAGMGLEFRVLVLVACVAIAWSAIEVVQDIARMKYKPVILTSGESSTTPTIDIQKK